MPQRFLTRINVDDFCPVNRRTLLRGLGTAALLTTAGGLYRGGVWASPVFAASPFTLGVASGDQAPDGEWYFEQHVRFPFVRQVDARTAAASLATYGERLFQQVFLANPQVYARYRTGLQAGVESLRLEIAGSPGVSALALGGPEGP